MEERFEREGRVVDALVAAGGWTPHLESLTDGPKEYGVRIGMASVRDGTPCKVHARQGHNTPTDPVCEVCPDCFKHAGRGMTFIDAARLVETGGIRRIDLAGIKTAGIEGWRQKGTNGKLPSYVKLSGGIKPSTLEPWFQAAEAGHSCPIVVWAECGDTGDGALVCFDAAEVVRVFGRPADPLPVGETYAKNTAPAIYYRWGDPRPSGGIRLAKLQAMGVYVDPTPKLIEPGVMQGPGWISYLEVRVSLSTIGIKRPNWTLCRIEDIPRLIDDPKIGFDWASLY